MTAAEFANTNLVPPEVEARIVFIDQTTRFYAGALEAASRPDDHAFQNIVQALRLKNGLPLLTDDDVIAAKQFYDNLRVTMSDEQQIAMVEQTQEILVSQMDFGNSTGAISEEKPEIPRQLRAAVAYAKLSLKGVSGEAKADRIKQLSDFLSPLGTSLEALVEQGYIDSDLASVPPKQS